MEVCIFLIIFWLGYHKFSLDTDTMSVSKQEFNKLMKNL